MAAPVTPTDTKKQTANETSFSTDANTAFETVSGS